MSIVTMFSILAGKIMDFLVWVINFSWSSKKKRLHKAQINITVLGLIALTLQALVTNGSAQESYAQPKRVLAIFVFKQGLPWAHRVEESLRADLAANSPFPIELNVEHADQSRYPDKKYLGKIIDLYRYKYSRQKVDLVLAIGDESTELLLEHRESLFGDIPVVLVTSDFTAVPSDLITANMTSLVWGWDMEKTILLIQDLLPMTQRLYIISGTSTTDQRIRSLAIEALSHVDAKWQVEHLSDLSADKLFERVANLPAHAAIFYLTVFRDATGKYFVPRDLMSVISEKANAPVFGIGDTYLGYGIVGGNLISAEKTGRRLANITVKRLREEPLTEEELTQIDSTPMFDWRQLKRWSIHEKRLPPGSIVSYRQPSIWRDYRGEILSIMVIIVAQAFALVLLLIQRKKRNQAEKESHRLQDELAHASRLLSMGEMATSLAHEINQPLAAMQSYAQAAQRFLSGDPPDLKEVKKSLSGIVVGSRRAREVIQHIRLALKKQTVKKSQLRLSDLIRDVKMLVERAAYEKNITLTFNLATGLPAVFGDRTQIQQVLLNLMINGFEAIGNDGSGPRSLEIRAVKKEPDFVEISVKDTGQGIDKIYQDIIFDAFYTTKADGLGMGLSISRSIIEDHGGRLWASPNTDRGVTFFFTVPIYLKDQG